MTSSQSEGSILFVQGRPYIAPPFQTGGNWRPIWGSTHLRIFFYFLVCFCIVIKVFKCNFISKLTVCTHKSVHFDDYCGSYVWKSKVDSEFGPNLGLFLLILSKTDVFVHLILLRIDPINIRKPFISTNTSGCEINTQENMYPQLSFANVTRTNHVKFCEAYVF